jgi:hypothetical protein
MSNKLPFRYKVAGLKNKSKGKVYYSCELEAEHWKSTSTAVQILLGIAWCVKFTPDACA